MHIYVNNISNTFAVSRVNIFSKQKYSNNPATSKTLAMRGTSKTTQNKLSENLKKEKIKEENGYYNSPVTDNTKKSTKELKDANVKEKDAGNYIDKKGRLTKEGEKLIKENKNKNVATKGHDEAEYSSENFNCQELAEDGAETYDDAAISSKIEELNKTIDNIDGILDNPMLLMEGAAILGEITPLTRFITPVVDLTKGDVGKASIGALTRASDILFSPVKLVAATGKGLSDSIIGMAMGEKDMTFVKGFKEFYSDWAKERNRIEDDILGRENNEEILEKLKEFQKELEAERERQIEEKRNKELLKRKQALAVQEQILQEKINTTLNELGGKDPNYKQKLNNARIEFELLLDGYKKLKPKADISKYAQWESWDLYKLKKNIRFLKNYVQINNSEINASKLTPEREKEMNTKILEKYDKQRNAFLRLLNEYHNLKPNSNISNYENWQNWGPLQLQKNMDLLRQKIKKLKK